MAQEGVDFRGSDIRYELLGDADACQRNCTEDPNCQFYTYVTENFSDRNYRYGTFYTSMQICINTKIVHLKKKKKFQQFRQHLEIM